MTSCNNNQGGNSKRISESQLYHLLNLSQTVLKLGSFIKIGKICLHESSGEFLRLSSGFFLNTVMFPGKYFNGQCFISFEVFIMHFTFNLHLDQNYFSHAVRRTIILKKNYLIKIYFALFSLVLKLIQTVSRLPVLPLKETLCFATKTVI